jgi:hypothetical protein
MTAYYVIYSILALLSLVTVYAVGTPIHKTMPADQQAAETN